MSALRPGSDSPTFAYGIRNDWLERCHETPVEPELEVVDAHHHFSDRPGYLYMLDEFLEDMRAGTRVIATVFIEGRMGDVGGDEVERGIAESGIAAQLGMLAEQRAIHGVCAAIVGNVDLTQSARVEEILHGHIEAGAGRFRGIRQICPWDRSEQLCPPGLSLNPALLSEPSFKAGFRQLAPLGLSFDAWLYYPQYDSLRMLAEEFPETRIMLDFPVPIGIGGYELGSRNEMDRWRTAVRTVAQCPNVVLKLGGFGLGMCGFRLAERENPPSSAELSDVIRPYFEESLESFGAGRCVLGSNFPIDKGSYGYTVFWNTCKKLLKQVSPAERVDVLSRNALRFYRIHPIAPCGGSLRPIRL